MSITGHKFMPIMSMYDVNRPDYRARRSGRIGKWTFRVGAAVLFLSGPGLTAKLHAQVSTSDCNGAIPLCGGLYTEVSAPLGTGNVYEFTGTCNQSLESASLWYTFTVQEAGDLSFILDPANDLDDYDWGLFNITSGGCAGIQDGSSPEVNCNSYGSLVTNGATGISSTNGGTGTTNGPGDLNGPPFNADLPVLVGQTYALVVMNWTGSPDGYTIDFTQSTANIYDQSAPYVVGVVPDCANQQFYVAFSENVVTSTVEPGDFQFISSQGQIYDCTAVIPDQAGTLSQNTFSIVFGPGIGEGGTFTLNITDLFGNIEDPCGNAVADTTFEVEFVAPPAFEVSATTACNGFNGAVQAVQTSGTAPAEFLVDGNAASNGYLGGLPAGAHSVTLIDASGCTATQQVIVPDHELQVSIPQEQEALSCAKPLVTIEGVAITPPQDVLYSWTALLPGDTLIGFSTSGAPQAGNAGIYSVQVTDPVTGCTATGSVVIGISATADLDLTGLVFPNVVSPNGDGENDTWRPFLPEDPGLDLSGFFREFDLVVHNRWGKVVHETVSGGQRSWNPRDAMDGTYYYRIALEADCGAYVERKGTGVITVVR
jgi:CHU_C Type IX secretion signal domain